MRYDSPTQIRRRQQQAENRATKRRRKAAPAIKNWSDEEWNRQCDFHLSHVHERGEAGWHDSVAAHARAIVHKAIQRRALQFMIDLNFQDIHKAMTMGRVELLGREVA